MPGRAPTKPLSSKRSNSNRPKASHAPAARKTPLPAAPRRADADASLGGHPWPPGPLRGRLAGKKLPLANRTRTRESASRVFYEEPEDVSAVERLARPHRIKAAHRRRWKCSTGHTVYAKDNPYRYTDPFGLFKCAASASASDCKTLTSQMKSAIKLIQKAADNLSDSAKFTNRIAGGNLNKLVTFLKSDNAVVGMGNSSSSSELGSAQGEAHHPVGITTLQAQRLRSKTADTSRIAV